MTAVVNRVKFREIASRFLGADTDAVKATWTADVILDALYAEGVLLVESEVRADALERAAHVLANTDRPHEREAGMLRELASNARNATSISVRKGENDD